MENLEHRRIRNAYQSILTVVLIDEILKDFINIYLGIFQALCQQKYIEKTLQKTHTRSFHVLQRT